MKLRKRESDPSTANVVIGTLIAFVLLSLVLAGIQALVNRADAYVLCGNTASDNCAPVNAKKAA